MYSNSFKRMPRICINSGFTLIEVMTIVAITAILMGIAIPSFMALMTTNRLTTQSSDLMSDLALARSEAAKRGGRVTVCMSSDGATCDTTTGTNWVRGRIVFVDASPYGTVDSADTILKVSNAVAGNITVVSSFTGGFISYAGNGMTNLGGVNNIYKFCKSGYVGRDITISVTGRAHSDPTTSTCP